MKLSCASRSEKQIKLQCATVQESQTYPLSSDFWSPSVAGILGLKESVAGATGASLCAGAPEYGDAILSNKTAAQQETRELIR